LVPLVGGGVLSLALLGGVGGWLALRDTKSNVNAVGPGVAKPKATGEADLITVVPTDAPRVEAASYWFEVFEDDKDMSGERVAEAAPTFSSKRQIRLHFTPKARGFLYLVGPSGDGNAQATFLTALGDGQPNGLKSNYAASDADFTYPTSDGDRDRRITLESRTNADEMTFIFSPQPIDSPTLAFFAAKPKKLSTTEFAELERFRAQFKADAPAFAVVGEGGERRVAVNVPATAEGRPLIFDVRVNHQK
jgi:hypothetical protein